MLRDADCPLHSDYKLLPITYYLLPITYYLLPITYYLLPITYYLLPITYYPLPPDSTRLGNPSRVVRITRAFAFMVALMEDVLECLTR